MLYELPALAIVTITGIISNIIYGFFLLCDDKTKFFWLEKAEIQLYNRENQKTELFYANFLTELIN